MDIAHSLEASSEDSIFSINSCRSRDCDQPRYKDRADAHVTHFWHYCAGLLSSLYALSFFVSLGEWGMGRVEVGEGRRGKEKSKEGTGRMKEMNKESASLSVKNIRDFWKCFQMEITSP